MNRKSYTSLLLALFFLGNLAFCPDLHAQAKLQPKRTVETLHSVLVFDTYANQAKQLGIDTALIEWDKNIKTIVKTLNLQPGKDLTAPHVLVADKVTPDQIRKTLKELEVNPKKDGVFFLYCGHGAFIPGQGHALILHGNKFLPRAEILQLLKQKDPALIVMLTDSCATPSDKSWNVVSNPNPPARMCECLFYYHTGIVDINACELGKEAFANREVGPACGYAFRQLLYGQPQYHQGVKKDFEDLEKNKTWNHVTWKQFSGWLRQETNAATRKVVQREQTPHIFSIPGGHFMGITIKPLDSQNPFQIPGGVWVQDVEKDSPAWKAGFRPTQVQPKPYLLVIGKINGQKILTVEDCLEAYQRSGPSMKVEILEPFGKTRAVREIALSKLPTEKLNPPVAVLIE